ncbi:Ni/Fe hydrogenase subunit alpha [Candidatus Micrarchaeota archaeon]|nr:Ni/Fe hydrogenase subunit alpha [Candidatus Micrarchaeota archaeon]
MKAGKRKITLEHLSKIEGHAKLRVKVENGVVEECEVQVVEGARFFEAILRGRKFHEAPSLTSRICGLCSVSHTIAALEAVENACNIKMNYTTMLLRELMHAGEFIQDHTLHTCFLALPDFLGFENAIEMAQANREETKKALHVKKIGNDMVEMIGGREVHPMTALVNGFSKLPSRKELQQMKEALEGAKEDAMAIAKVMAQLPYPEFERETQYVSVVGSSYLGDLIATCKGNECFPQKNFADYLDECMNPESTAKYVVRENKEFMVGSLARFNVNMQHLSKNAKKIVRESKIKFPNYNPFYNNFAQAVETVHCMDKARTIIGELEGMEMEKYEDVCIDAEDKRAKRGIGAIEAPRGTLYHDYTISGNAIQSANIITPTAQNLKNIEEDVKAFLPTLLEKDKKEIIRNLENLVRAYDPCISCSAHFLTVEGI